MNEMGLALSGPVGVSGAFLVDKKRFSAIQKLSVDYSRLSSRLAEVQYKLRCCNDSEWLASFENRCRRLKRDPERELVELADSLEIEKAALTTKVAESRLKLLQLEPTALDLNYSLVGASSQYGAPFTRPASKRERNPALEARNKVIDCLLHLLNDLAICKALDEEFPPTKDRPASQFPNRWFVRLGVKSFEEAYCKCPHLVHTLIWKRRRLQSTCVT
jgi:hypothetical protein